jgi:hypothetical protein
MVSTGKTKSQDAARFSTRNLNSATVARSKGLMRQSRDTASLDCDRSLRVPTDVSPAAQDQDWNYVQHKGSLMSGDADRRKASAELAYRPGAVGSEPASMSALILNALSRDHELRRAYVRRRWQGLIERDASPSPARSSLGSTHG